MLNILKYLDLGLSVLESVTAFQALIAAKQKVTGAQVQAAAQPAISGIETAFGVTIPAGLVSDICDAAATAIDKYVFSA